MRAVLAPYHERVRREIESFGGVVEKFIGDAVMGVFGAPLAHGDDAERAVRAALVVRDIVGELAGGDLQIRIAVNTGEAVVSLGARPALGESMVAGDVVNTAARLQAAAPVNGVVVGEETYVATRDAIEYAPTDPVIAKGKAASGRTLGSRSVRSPRRDSARSRSRDRRPHVRDRDLERAVGADVVRAAPAPRLDLRPGRRRQVDARGGVRAESRPRAARASSAAVRSRTARAAPTGRLRRT